MYVRWSGIGFCMRLEGHMDMTMKITSMWNMKSHTLLEDTIVQGECRLCATIHGTVSQKRAVCICPSV